MSKHQDAIVSLLTEIAGHAADIVEQDTQALDDEAHKARYAEEAQRSWAEMDAHLRGVEFWAKRLSAARAFTQQPEPPPPKRKKPES